MQKTRNFYFCLPFDLLEIIRRNLFYYFLRIMFWMFHDFYLRRDRLLSLTVNIYSQGLKL